MGPSGSPFCLPVLAWHWRRATGPSRPIQHARELTKGASEAGKPGPRRPRDPRVPGSAHRSSRTLTRRQRLAESAPRGTRAGRRGTLPPRASQPPPYPHTTGVVGRGAGRACLPYRLDPPSFAGTPPRQGTALPTPLHPAAAASRAGESLLGAGNDTTTRPRAPDGRPGALQEHRRGTSSTRRRDHGEGLAAWRRGGLPSLPRERGPPARTRPTGQRRGCPLRPGTPGPPTPPGRGREDEIGPDSARPWPLFSLLTRHHTAQQRMGAWAGTGQEARGPARTTRRAVPFALNVCPSVWRGSGPAQESARSPHRSGAHGDAPACVGERGGEGGPLRTGTGDGGPLSASTRPARPPQG